MYNVQLEDGEYYSTIQVVQRFYTLMCKDSNQRAIAYKEFNTDIYK